MAGEAYLAPGQGDVEARKKVLPGYGPEEGVSQEFVDVNVLRSQTTDTLRHRI
jgi:hypothetical protein